ncbi:TnsD family Tn7-like transposition protein [Desulfovibrionaceae bacterium CB1MN]
MIRLSEKEGKSLRATARALGVDVKTVIRHLARLADCRQEENFIEVGQSLIERRTRWLALIAPHPQKGRKELRALGPADYCWLYRNDQKWLFENLPPVKSRKGAAGCRVDWPGRDRELGARVGPVAHAILYAPGRPVRVTISAIGKKLGALGILQRNIDKLPVARASLEGVIETRDSFEIRRVRAAARELLRCGESLEPWRIVRKAHLRPEYPASVAAEIERIIYAFEKGVIHGDEI